MKKLLALFLACLLVSAFAACSGNEDDGNADGASNDVSDTASDTENVGSEVIIDLGSEFTTPDDGPFVSGTARPLPGN